MRSVHFAFMMCRAAIAGGSIPTFAQVESGGHRKMSGLPKTLFGGGEDEIVDQAQDMAAQAGVPQDVIDQASGLMDGGIPDVAELKSAVDKLSPEELTSAATKALDMVPADTRAQFGHAIQSYVSKSGGSVQVPAGVASGNSADMAAALTTALKGGGGLDSLAGSGATDAVTSAVSSMTGSGGGAGGLNIAGLLNNPMAITVLAALIPAIMKAASGK
jgi:hypothetical protein